MTVVSTGYFDISNMTEMVLNKVKATPTTKMTSQTDLRITLFERPALFKPEMPALKSIGDLRGLCSLTSTHALCM